MKNLRLLRRYIRESIDLGNVQFSPNRLDNVDKTEPNTQTEKDLYDALKRRLSGGPITKPTADLLKQLINSPKYGVEGSGFFAGPSNRSIPLYRGHAYSSSWVKKHVTDRAAIPKIYNSEARLQSHIDSNKPIQLNPPYVFGPNSGEGFRGWTPNIEVATAFAMDYAKRMNLSFLVEDIYEHVYATVLVLHPDRNPPDSLLDFKNGIYKTDPANALADEEEVLNIEPITCHEAWLGRYSDD